MEHPDHSSLCVRLLAAVLGGASEAAVKYLAKASHAAVAHAIARFEPVLIVARPGGGVARSYCGSDIEVAELPIDDSQLRHSGPIFLREPGRALAAADFRLNAWGKSELREGCSRQLSVVTSIPCPSAVMAPPSMIMEWGIAGRQDARTGAPRRPVLVVGVALTGANERTACKRACLTRVVVRCITRFIRRFVGMVTVMGKSRLEQLSRWRQEASEELELLQRQLSELQKKAEEAKVRVSLVDRLLALEGDADERQFASLVEEPSLLDACEAILRKQGHPMHIKDIYAELIAQSIPIPGKGNEANVIARLQRSGGRIIRTGRGTYSLPEFGIAEQKPTKQRRRARRK